MVARGGFGEIPREPGDERDLSQARRRRRRLRARAEVQGRDIRRSRRGAISSGLKLLLEQFATRIDALSVAALPKFLGRGADYDHLARVKEWSATGGLAAAAGDAP